MGAMYPTLGYNVPMMSRRTREVWHCDVCGWEWLPDTNKVPERCPNRKCRKRSWNQQEAHDNAIAESLIRAEAIRHTMHDLTCTCLICRPPK
jgi:hypothetical protein